RSCLRPAPSHQPRLPDATLCPTKAGTNHKRHKRGTQKTQKKRLCAFCVPSPICWAKPYFTAKLSRSKNETRHYCSVPTDRSRIDGLFPTQVRRPDPPTTQIPGSL